MARAYDETISLTWSLPAERVLPPNPDPLSSRLPRLPFGVYRVYISSPAGPLEVLYSLPSGGTLDSPGRAFWKSPVLFVHGGFGSADCFFNFLPWLSVRSYPAYSLSVRGHGHSWYPSFWKMLFTSKNAVADDVVSALKFIQTHHSEAGPVSLVGHSAGGGLIQHVMDSGRGTGVGKLAIIAGFPCYGGLKVYLNWFKLDPWFPIRLLKHFYHPRSPLSSTRLVHQAFFSPTYPIEKVRTFESAMPPYESLSWPIGMMFPFVSCARVLMNLFASFPSPLPLFTPKPSPLLVIAGQQDTLMGVPLMRRMAHMYAATNVGIGAGVRDVSKIQHYLTSGVQDESDKEGEAEEGAVWFAEITAPGAGHNLMKDDGWERCVGVLKEFLDN
ncbi:alpha/beta-hydrolase [Ceratobasidium sp. AG-I]|nr:alpha/beta-hydrolase [Ceratobasidium sp. AG-I]